MSPTLKTLYDNARHYAAFRKSDKTTNYMEYLICFNSVNSCHWIKGSPNDTLSIPNGRKDIQINVDLECSWVLATKDLRLTVKKICKYYDPIDTSRTDNKTPILGILELLPDEVQQELLELIIGE